MDIKSALFALIVILFMVLGIIFFGHYDVASGAEVPIIFSWDANNNSGTWKTVKIFVRLNNDHYDYSTPLIEIPQQYENGLSLPIQATVNFNFPDGYKTTAYFVAKAYGDNDKFSEDSNEVIKVVDLLKLEPFTFTADYNAEDNSINFQWAISDVRAARYRIYKASEENGDYTPFERIDYVEGQTSYSKVISIEELFPENQKTTVYFKMQSWAGEKPELISSDFSNIIPITIDRREGEIEIDRVINFKLILE